MVAREKKPVKYHNELQYPRADLLWLYWEAVSPINNSEYTEIPEATSIIYCVQYIVHYTLQKRFLVLESAPLEILPHFCGIAQQLRVAVRRWSVAVYFLLITANLLHWTIFSTHAECVPIGNFFTAQDVSAQWDSPLFRERNDWKNCSRALDTPSLLNAP